MKKMVKARMRLVGRMGWSWGSGKDWLVPREWVGNEITEQERYGREGKRMVVDLL